MKHTVAMTKEHTVAMTKEHTVAMTKEHTVALTKAHTVAMTKEHTVAMTKEHIVAITKEHTVAMTKTYFLDTYVYFLSASSTLLLIFTKLTQKLIMLIKQKQAYLYNRKLSYYHLKPIFE